jgi:hypothetical protein
MAGLVVAQLLLQGRVVLLELVPTSGLPGIYRLQLTAGESSYWPTTRLPSWRAERALLQHRYQRMVYRLLLFPVQMGWQAYMKLPVHSTPVSGSIMSTWQ